MSTSCSNPPCIVFIGGGNMCEAMLSGLLKTGHPKSLVRVSEPWDQRQEYLRKTYGVSVYADNNEAVSGTESDSPRADVVLLAVKPQVVGQVVRGIAAVLRDTRPLVVSIVAGVAIKDFARWIRTNPDGSQTTEAVNVPIVRLMPNTPALYGEGAAGMFADSDVSAAQRSQTEYVVCNIAKEYFWVDSEAGVDDVCSVSGSGPAYFFLVIEAMEQKAVELGLPRQVARRLAAQTALGAAKMVLEAPEDQDVASLRKNVTSPNGTTHAGIQQMIKDGVPEGIASGMQACRDRCTSLSDEFGKL
ncbi:hypothetical protein FBU31_002366 [Coemansia sp. 'formosensis']|nr:hypothetical protein FBU31_002366 [Coemansia sp. 'formosensis']